MANHFNKGVVFGKLAGLERKKSEGGKPYIQIYLECPNDLHGDAKVYGRMWGEDRVNAFMAGLNRDGKLLMGTGLRLEGFFSQYDAEDGLYWANAAHLKDKFMNAYFSSLRHGRKLHFHAFDGNLRFEHVFTSGGIPAEKIFTDNPRQKRIRITPISRDIYQDRQRGIISQREMKRKARTEALITLAGLQMRFRTILHRPVPEGSILKKAVIKRIRTGRYNYRWTLSLTVEVPPDDSMPAGQAPAGKTAGLDVGYRMIDGRLRVGYLAGDAGQMEIYLPGRIMERFIHVQELQQKSDALLEEMKARLVEMLPEGLPAELKANWHMARHGRLRKIIRWLADNSPEHIALRELRKWERQDAAIQNEKEGLRRRAIRQRQWFYYNLAHRLAGEYGTLVIESLKPGDLQRKTQLDDDRTLPRRASFYRGIAAVGALLDIIQDVGRRKGMTVHKVDPAYTTLTCHVCGHVVEPVDRASLLWCCDGCGSEWDQDYNAAYNLYMSGRESKEAKVA
ncbi:MAG: transposase [Deferribacteres bacterium]|nr:transposase [Deferribacteres bacterium]